MAFIDPQKLDALFRKFQTGGEYNPKDGEPPEISESDQALIKSIFSEYERIIARREKGGSGLQDSNDFFSKILLQFKKDAEAFENAKKYLSYDTEEASQVKSQIIRQQMSRIKYNIEKYAVAGELASDAAKRAQEIYKQLKKQLEVEARFQKGVGKGAAIAEKTLQSTLGISKSFDGPGGILASVQGFAKGMKETLTATNILMSLTKKMLEQAVTADKARGELFRRSGMSDFTQELLDISSDLTSAYGPGSLMASAEVVADLQSEMKVFRQFKDSGEIVQMSKMSGRLKKLGVSTTAMGSIYQSLSVGIGMGSKEMDTTVKTLYKMGKESGMTQQETFDSFAKTLPTYARFGRKAPQMFSRLAATARQANIKVEDLMAMTEDLDTSENALKTAAKLNSLLGGSFINGVALLAADASGKVKMIADAYQKAEAQFGTPNQRVVRAMQGYMGSAGVSAENFQKIVRGQFTDFNEAVANQEGPATDEEIIKDVGKSLSQADRIDAAMAKLVQRLNSAIYKAMPAITRAVSFLADHSKISAPLILAAGAAASAAYLKSKVDETIRIPALKMEITALKATINAQKAVNTANNALGAGGCLKQIGKTIFGTVATSTVAGEVTEMGVKEGTKALGGAAAQSSGGILSRYASKIGSALSNSKILKTISKFPIIEFLFAAGETALIMSRDDLDLKAKSRAIVEALTGALGGWLGGLGGAVIGNALNIAAPGLGFIVGLVLRAAGSMLGQYLGRLLGASAIGQAFSDNIILPLMKGMGFSDGKLVGKAAKLQNNALARGKTNVVTEPSYRAKDRSSELLSINDSPTAMKAVPMKKKDFQTARDDGALLEGLDNLRKGLITLRDSETSVSLEVGGKTYAATNGGLA